MDEDDSFGWNLFGDDDGAGGGAASAELARPAAAGDSGAASRLKPAAYYEPPGEHGFVGLANQGATCYLNSLLQTMFLTPELRAGLYGLTDGELGMRYLVPPDEDGAAPAPAAAAAADAPWFPDEANAEQLQGMGFTPAQAVAALRRARAAQGGAGEAVELLLGGGVPDADVERADRELAERDAGAAKEGAGEDDPENPKRRAWKIPIALRRLFAFLQGCGQAQTSTAWLTWAFGWHAGQQRVQHDIQELNRVLMDRLDQSLRHTRHASLVRDLYGGELVSRVRCKGCGMVSERTEEFFDLSVPVKGLPNLAASLARLVAPEYLRGDNQYRCSMGCGNTKQDAVKDVALRRLPPLLTVSLNRFVFDYRTMQRSKVLDRFAFPLVLDVAPYTEASVDAAAAAAAAASAAAAAASAGGGGGGDDGAADDPDAAARARAVAEADELARQLEALEKARDKLRGRKKGGGGNAKKGKRRGGRRPRGAKDAEPEAPAGVAGQTPATAGDPGADRARLLDEAERRVEEARERQRALLERELDAGGDGGAMPYELAAVVIHVGTAYGGHYHAYVRDTAGELDPASRPPASRARFADGEQRWYDFNDSSVTPLRTSQLADQFGGRRESAYMLVYRRRGERAPEPPLPPALEAEMGEHRRAVAEGRAELDRATNLLRLEVHAEARFAAPGAPDAAALAEADGAPAGAAVEIDRRRTAADLAAAVGEALGGRPPASLLLLETSRRPLSVRAQLDVLRPPSGLEPDQARLVDLGVRDGAELLAWDGAALHGAPWTPPAPAPLELDDPSADLFAGGAAPLATASFRALVFGGGGGGAPDAEVSLTLLASTTLGDALRRVAARCAAAGAPASARGARVYLLYKRLGAPWLLEPAAASKHAAASLDELTLQQAGVFDGCTLAVEPEAAAGRALAHLEAVCDRVELCVAVDASLAGGATTVRVRDANLRGTVGELRAAALRLCGGAAGAASPCRLRRAAGPDPRHLGDVLEDEAQTLREAGLAQDGLVLLLEPGAVPRAGEELCVLAAAGPGLAYAAEVLPRAATVGECKARLLRALGDARDPSSVRLVRVEGVPGSGAETAGKRIDSEHVPVGRMKLAPPAPLWLVDAAEADGLGAARPCRLDVHLFIPCAPHGAGAAEAAAAAAGAGPPERVPEGETAAAFCARLAAAVAAGDEAAVRGAARGAGDDGGVVVPVFRGLPADAAAPLRELKRALLARAGAEARAIEEAEEAAAAAPPGGGRPVSQEEAARAETHLGVRLLSRAGGAARVRVRQLRKNFTPGRVLASDDLSLASQGVQGGARKLVLEVLPADAPPAGKGATLHRVYACVPRFTAARGAAALLEERERLAAARGAPRSSTTARSSPTRSRRCWSSRRATRTTTAATRLRPWCLAPRRRSAPCLTAAARRRSRSSSRGRPRTLPRPTARRWPSASGCSGSAAGRR